MPHHDHLGRYVISDLLLDTEYYNAHTTAMEALYMGCPMITCPGNTFTSRAGGAIVNALGMPELICKDIKEYEDKVVELCTTPGALKKLREKVLEKITSSDLFNTEKFTRSFEKACHEMYEECVGKFCQKSLLASVKTKKTNSVFDHANQDSVLIFEVQEHHGECLPSWIKYFNDLGFHVDVLVVPEMLKLNPFIRLPKDLDYSINEIQPQDRVNVLNDKKLLNYKHILISTTAYTYFPLKSVLQEYEVFKKHPSLYIVEHDLRFVNPNKEYEFAKNNKMLTLWNFKMGTMVNPSYFGDIKITSKNVTTFIVVGNVIKMRKNYQFLFDTIFHLLNRTKNFHVVVIGKIFDEYFIPSEIKPYITLTGHLNFPEMYNYMEKADFFLPLLDNNFNEHKAYLDSVTTGSLQLILGFRKIPLIQEIFAKFYEFNTTNALIYIDDLESAMLKAIEMSPQQYDNLQSNLSKKAEIITDQSLKNLHKLLSQS